MKKELQKLIEQMKDRRNYYSAAKQVFESEKIKLQSEARFEESNFCIQQLTLLLDSENEKSSQSSQEDGSNSSNAM